MKKNNAFYLLIVGGGVFITSAIGLLLYFYLSSPRVITTGPDKWGGPEQFGQFGDMIGGLLNPLFGFITILVVLYSANIQRNELQRNKNLRDIESLHRLLEQSKINFFTNLKNNDLLDQPKNQVYSVYSALENGERLTERGLTLKRIITKIHASQSFNQLSQSGDFDLNHITIYNLINDYRRVINHFKELISLEDFHYAQVDIAAQLKQFHMQTYTYELITKEENKAIADVIKQYANT